MSTFIRPGLGHPRSGPSLTLVDSLRKTIAETVAEIISVVHELPLVRLVHDLESRPLQRLTVYMAPERSRFLMDIAGDSINTLSAGQIVHDVPGRPSRGGVKRER